MKKVFMLLVLGFLGFSQQSFAWGEEICFAFNGKGKRFASCSQCTGTGCIEKCHAKTYKCKAIGRDEAGYVQETFGSAKSEAHARHQAMSQCQEYYSNCYVICEQEIGSGEIRSCR